MAGYRLQVAEIATIYRLLAEMDIFLKNYLVVSEKSRNFAVKRKAKQTNEISW